MAGFIIAVLVVLAGAGYLCAQHFSKRTTALRAMQEVPTRPIGELRDGEHARIVGLVGYTVAPIRAPQSGRECVCYEVVIEKYRGTVDAGYWKEVSRKHGSVPEFTLQQQGEICIVSTNAAEFVIDLDHQKSSGPYTNNWLERFGLRRRWDFFAFRGSYRYYEGIIEAGERVAATGKCRFEIDTSSGGTSDYRGHATRRRLIAPDRHPMLISDEPESLKSASPKESASAKEHVWKS